MWELVFIIFAIASLSISAAVSLSLKDSPDVQNVAYLNNVILVISTAVLTAIVTFALTARHVCNVTVYGSYSFYAVVALIVFSIATLIFSIMMVSNRQFAQCPARAKTLIIVGLTLNIAFIIFGIGYAIQTQGPALPAARGAAR